ncbi:unnamed protein product [Nezara viridula]|uniref:Uncharacterized protein n=1 Tax=Nezara viridula TaxID=85310 RepID=A0A9P0MVF1_NEZVI|nr:unnamed protein product [Nezara viridula]
MAESRFPKMILEDDDKESDHVIGTKDSRLLEFIFRGLGMAKIIVVTPSISQPRPTAVRQTAQDYLQSHARGTDSEPPRKADTV